MAESEAPLPQSDSSLIAHQPTSPSALLSAVFFRLLLLRVLTASPLYFLLREGKKNAVDNAITAFLPVRHAESGRQAGGKELVCRSAPLYIRESIRRWI